MVWTIFENLESEAVKKNVLLVIAPNIAVLLMTASVLQGHIL